MEPDETEAESRVGLPTPIDECTMGEEPKVQDENKDKGEREVKVAAKRDEDQQDEEQQQQQQENANDKNSHTASNKVST